MELLSIDQLAPEDRAKVLTTPEPGFDPRRNQMVMQKVIDSGVKVAVTLRRAQEKDMQHRVDVLATYARHAFNGGEKTLKQFVGVEGMKQIYGDKIMEKIRIMDSVRRLNMQNGNTMMGGNFILS